MNCPCGSSKDYHMCCGPFLEGKKLPELPEELMRSRYTAFTKGNVDYLQSTMQGKALVGFDAKNTKAWALSVDWLGLSVLKAPPPEKETGWVEFIARFKEAGNEYQIHELSQFRKIEGKWFYTEGKHFS